MGFLYSDSEVKFLYIYFLKNNFKTSISKCPEIFMLISDLFLFLDYSLR